MRERGGAVTGLLAAIGLVVVLMAIIFAVCLSTTGASQSRSLGRIQLASHERDRCYDDCGDDGWGGGSDGNSGGDYEGGRSGDNDQRGDHNCRNFCFYGIPAPGGGQDQPQSLFPPTPQGIRDFVVNTIKAGIDMGRLFADTTITFVSNLMVGIA